ncbi:MAG: fatty acid desaturase [Ferrimicrobium sp.]
MIVKSLIIALVVTQLAIMATTIYLHRAASHHSLRLSRPTEFGFRLLLWLTTGINRQQWVGVHRRHHAYTDLEGDPHSPVQMGYWRVQLLNFFYYRKAANDRISIERYTRDLPMDHLDRVLFRHTTIGLGVGVGVLIVLFGPEVAVLTAIFHLVMYISLSSAINAIGHTYGKRPFANLATNNQWLALITFGEGLHNNHHALPTSARLSLGRGQIDLGWYVITLMRLCRLTTVRTLSKPTPHPA